MGSNLVLFLFPGSVTLGSLIASSQLLHFAMDSTVHLHIRYCSS